YFLQRIDRRTEGRDVDALQRGGERRSIEPDFLPAPARSDYGDSAFLSFVRIHGDFVFAGGDRDWRCIPSESAGFAGDRGSSEQVCGDLPAGDADVSECLRASVHTGRVRKLAICDGGG